MNTSAVVPFYFQSHEIRTITDEQGDPWFVAKDVCNVLDIKNPSQAVGQLNDDERAIQNIGRQGDTNLISESGLYRLIFRSNKPEAESFRRWVFREVLPQIRKTGYYTTALVAAPYGMLTPDKLNDVGMAARSASLVVKSYGLGGNRPLLRKLVNTMVIEATGFDMLLYLRNTNLLPEDPHLTRADEMINTFLLECCEVDDEARVGAACLYAAFCLWFADRSAGKAPGVKIFSTVVGSCFQKVKNNQIFYCGLRLNSEVTI